MNHKSKVAILSLLSGGILFFVLKGLLPMNNNSLETAFISWGQFLLVYLVGMVILDIIGVFIINLFFSEEGFNEVVDERDHFIERVVMKRFSILFSAGFILSLVFLVLTKNPYIFFTIMTWTVFVVRSLVWISYILAYEKGI